MNLTSRYATVDDCNNMLGHWRIPDDWWSRKAEYPWAAQFVTQGNRVADMACGIPHFFKNYLAANAEQVIAVDQDAELKNLTCVPDNLKLMVSSICSVPEIADDWADVSYCISVLEHMPISARAAALNELKRVTKPGGLVVTTFDVPYVTPEEYGRMATVCGLRWAGNVDMTMPANALYSDKFNLHVFMTVLRKPE